MADSPQIPRSLVLQYLARVLGSPAFARAERLKRFLQFVVELTIAGRGEEIKESTIALDVCGRDASFDPRIDPIVRVDATRLRARLREYYQAEGRYDQVRFDLPKGAYVPTLVVVSPPTDTSRPVASVAVLPFISLGTEQSGESFGDGLTDELINQLSRVHGLRTIARTSAFQYRGKAGDLRRIAADLNVGHIVEGSVQAVGDRIRVTAQLTDAASCTIQWSAKYERELTDVLRVQENICSSVASALRVELAGGQTPVPPSGRARAHVEYLKGRHFWNRRTAGSLAQSLDHYARAIDLDASHAPAYAGMADTLLVQALNDHVPAAEVMPRAAAHASRALAIVPDLPEALTSLASIASVYEWDWAKGDALFRRAVAQNPNSATARYLYAVFNLAPRALWEEALIEMDKAVELDPVSPVLCRDLGMIHYLRGQYREAEDAFRTARNLDSGFHGVHFWLGRTLAEQGRLDEALEALQTRLAGPQPNARVVAVLIHTLNRTGRRDDAARAWAELRARAANERVPPLSLAIAYLGLGELDACLDQLERGGDERASTLYQIAVDPIYRPIGHHPRFAALVNRMGLGVTPSA
jgi:serine/threonine-protein kinase